MEKRKDFSQQLRMARMEPIADYLEDLEDTLIVHGLEHRQAVLKLPCGCCKLGCICPDHHWHRGAQLVCRHHRRIEA